MNTTIPEKPNYEFIDWQIFLLRKRTDTLKYIVEHDSFGELCQKAAKRILEDRGVI